MLVEKNTTRKDDMMADSSKKSWFGKIINSFHTRRYKLIAEKYRRKQKIQNLKYKVQSKSHSLVWVWEFSKKAVLICFTFYMIVQVYSMFVMVKYCDFSNLGNLIDQTGSILQNCVFAYLIKAGVENVGKIWFNKESASRDEAEG